MKGKTPVIGVCAHMALELRDTQLLNSAYTEALYQAGAVAAILPVPSIQFRRLYTEIAEQAVNAFDALLLPGGEDLDAGLYGQENLPFNGQSLEEEDEFDIALVHAAVEASKPILGICKGEQVLNVALGGTLYQDIYEQNEGRQLLKHRQESRSYTTVHEICIEGGSLARRILLPAEADKDEMTYGACFERMDADNFPHDKSGAEGRIRVNSYHHQAVRDVACGLKAVARTSDGIIEAIEPDGTNDSMHPFTIGVQWHPELLFGHYRAASRLFSAFILSAGKSLCLNKPIPKSYSSGSAAKGKA